MVDGCDVNVNEMRLDEMRWVGWGGDGVVVVVVVTVVGGAGGLGLVTCGL